MAKSQTKFICQSCGAEHARWQGKCDQCGEWNSLVETVISIRSQKSKILGRAGGGRKLNIKPQRLNNIKETKVDRLATGISEFDRVLGSSQLKQGIIPGSLVLISGDPGIGKSTLVLQVASEIAKKNKGEKILYISGEESENQLKVRAKRLNVDSSNLFVISETNVENIIQIAQQENPTLLIIDSIQTMYSDELTGAPGNVGQVNLCTSKLMELAKKEHIATLIVGHVTKEGNIAGPKVLEHMVDVVLYLEGEKYGSFRVLRGIKNRFGSTNEAGIFEMEEKGLIEVKNPSKALLSEKAKDTSGSVVFCTMEGTRPLLVEVQALTSISNFGYPTRRASGLDFNRLQLLVAVLTKRLGINLSNQDIYVNIVGGMAVKEPALDLVVCVAIVSAFKDKTVDSDTVILGEVGLSGEVRLVSNLEKRIKEASKLGFKKCIIPKSGIRKISEIKSFEVKTISEAIKIALAK